jgi:hypothetical protein
LSITSKWTTSAPAASTFVTSSPSLAKSAERIDGAIRNAPLPFISTDDLAAGRASADAAGEKAMDEAKSVTNYTRAHQRAGGTCARAQ